MFANTCLCTRAAEACKLSRHRSRRDETRRRSERKEHARAIPKKPSCPQKLGYR